QAEQALATAKKELETTQKNVANLRATAPIAGTVIGLSIKPGQEIAANATVITISDTSSIVVEAKIDERNISLVTPGTTVEIDQWGQLSTGTVESVSLKGTFENGITTFPAIINVDNSMGTMMSGSSVIYRITASQSDDCLILPIQCVKSVASGEEGKNISVVFVQSETRPDNAVDVDPSSLGIPAGYFAVPVTTGISDKYKVEILDGVEEGTAVFTQIVQENTFGF
ncbi:MAG: HlyD family efflux transporter periplasmic adaptor subunit, partial [Oscillospiraceae bacterium]